jgi:hypothetical protein
MSRLCGRFKFRKYLGPPSYIHHKGTPTYLRPNPDLGGSKNMKTHGVNIIHNILSQTVFLLLLQKARQVYGIKLEYQLGYHVTAVVLGMAMTGTHCTILLQVTTQCNIKPWNQNKSELRSNKGTRRWKKKKITRTRISATHHKSESCKMKDVYDSTENNKLRHFHPTVHSETSDTIAKLEILTHGPVFTYIYMF